MNGPEIYRNAQRYARLLGCVEGSGALESLNSDATVRRKAATEVARVACEAAGQLEQALENDTGVLGCEAGINAAIYDFAAIHGLATVLASHDPTSGSDVGMRETTVQCALSMRIYELVESFDNDDLPATWRVEKAAAVAKRPLKAAARPRSKKKTG